MTVVTTQIATAIDTLVALFQTAVGSSITVLDGTTTGMEFPEDWIAVGSAGAFIESEQGASSRQVWNGLGAKTKDESVVVTCSCGSSSGNVTAAGFKPVRDRAVATMALMEAAIRADPGLGGITMGAAGLTEIDMFYESDSQGIQCALVFTISVPFRLEST